MRRITIFCLFAAIAFAGCSAPQADQIYLNGTIYTVDAEFSQAEAVAVRGSEIIFVGSEEEAKAYVGADTETIDLEGKTMLPGLIDSHYHFLGVGRREFFLNLDGAASFDEFLARIREAAAESQEPYLYGRGWMEADWPSKRFPTRQDIDKILRDKPVILVRADGHALVANSKALAISGINKDTPDPQGGRIMKDAKTGEPTGLLIDKAMGLLSGDFGSDDGGSRLPQFALAAQRAAFAYGLTQVHDMGSSWQDIEAWRKLYASGDLKIRIAAYIRGPGKDVNRLLEEGLPGPEFDQRFAVRGIKISQDGALGSRGAALLEPYSDDGSPGLLIYNDIKLQEIINNATAQGIQMAIHAIGDRANRNILDLYEVAFEAVPASERAVKEPRFRVEHAQIVAPEDMPRFKQLGVIPSMQPSHAIGDMKFAIHRLGMQRMTRGYAWRTLIDNGNVIPGGSDAPVEEGNPMLEFYASVVRKDTTGFEDEGWHRELRMTREEGIRSLTTWGAYAVFEEDKKGSIEAGKWADFVVLDKDPMQAAEQDLFNIKVEMTIVAGEVVYQRSADRMRAAP